MVKSGGKVGVGESTGIRVVWMMYSDNFCLLFFFFAGGGGEVRWGFRHMPSSKKKIFNISFFFSFKTQVELNMSTCFFPTFQIVERAVISDWLLVSPTA